MRSITISLDVRQAIDAPDELAIRRRIVRAPSAIAPDELAIRRRIVRAPSATHAALAALQIRTFEVAKRWIARRKRAAPFGRSDTVVHHASVVVLRLRSRGGGVRHGAGQQHRTKEHYKKRSHHGFGFVLATPFRSEEDTA